MWQLSCFVKLGGEKQRISCDKLMSRARSKSIHLFLSFQFVFGTMQQKQNCAPIQCVDNRKEDSTNK